jgi:hypothetical protein
MGLNISILFVCRVASPTGASAKSGSRAARLVTAMKFGFLPPLCALFGRRPSEPSGTLTRWAGIRKPLQKRKMLIGVPLVGLRALRGFERRGRGM